MITPLSTHPFAQLFPAPEFPNAKLSGLEFNVIIYCAASEQVLARSEIFIKSTRYLNSCPVRLAFTASMVPGSRSARMARGTQLVSVAAIL